MLWRCKKCGFVGKDNKISEHFIDKHPELDPAIVVDKYLEEAK